MIFRVSDGVFAADRRDDLALFCLFDLCRNSRHQLLTTPLWDERSSSHLKTWIASLAKDLQLQLTATLEAGLKEATAASAGPTFIVVTDGEGEMSSPPRVGIETARDLLSRPLEVVVENSRNDRAFFEKSLPASAEFDYLRQAISNSWLTFRHMGGIDEMAEQLKVLDNSQADRMRRVAFFDSDAPHPNEPSDSATKVKEKAEDYCVEHQMLSRRAIENYLPPSMLFVWADRHSGQQKTRSKKRAAAFKRLLLRQQKHLHLKRGLSPNEWRQDPFWSDVSGTDQQELSSGFGNHLARLFSNRIRIGSNERAFPWDSPSWQQALSTDPDLIELTTMVQRHL
ncbi:MAG: hypothetical protein KAI47_09495 [Deltaproteobacteria bacterium]|nr:hypothetical protein [Deltaproteobacteria bacterium]